MRQINQKVERNASIEVKEEGCKFHLADKTNIAQVVKSITVEGNSNKYASPMIRDDANHVKDSLMLNTSTCSSSEAHISQDAKVTFNYEPKGHTDQL